MRWMMGMAGGLLACAGLVQAENLLAVAPLRLLLNDTQTSEMLTLTNRSGSERTYKLVLQDQVMTPGGVIGQQDDFAYSAKRMLRFMPRTITLAAGQRQNVRVMAMLPERLAAGDYHTHLLFEPVVAEGAGADSATAAGFKVAMESQYSVGIPVVVQHGVLASEVGLREAKVETQKGRAVVNVWLTRHGNSEATALVRLVDKATGENVAPPRTMHVYREVDEVLVQLPLKESLPRGKALEVRVENDGKVLGTAAVQVNEEDK